MTVCQAIGISAVALRYQNVYGPGQSLSNPYTGILSIFSSLVRSRSSINIFEDGMESRDFVYIDDVANAILASMDSTARQSAPYDVGSGQASTVLELGRLVAEYYGAPQPIINGSFRHGDVRSASCSIEEATNALKWAPSVMLPEGLRRLSGWIDRSL